MKLKFIQDAYISGELAFEKGKVYDITTPGSADRWIRRGVAEVFIEVALPKEETLEDSVVAKKQSPKRKNKEQAEELL
jgi:hypothetical protein